MQWCSGAVLYCVGLLPLSLVFIMQFSLLSILGRLMQWCSVVLCWVIALVFSIPHVVLITLYFRKTNAVVQCSSVLGYRPCL